MLRTRQQFDRACTWLLILGVAMFCAGVVGLTLLLKIRGVLP